MDDVAARREVVTVRGERARGATHLHLAALEDAQRGVDGRVARRLRGDHDRGGPLRAARGVVAGDGVTLDLIVAREPECAIIRRLREQRPRSGRLVANDVTDLPGP